MSIFGGRFATSQSQQTQSNLLGTVSPDGREIAASIELSEAEKAYGAAEDRLIKARRAYEETLQEWRKFHYPGYQQR